MPRTSPARKRQPHGTQVETRPSKPVSICRRIAPPLAIVACLIAAAAIALFVSPSWRLDLYRVWTLNQPQNAQAQRLLGEELIANDLPAEAVLVLERALRLDPVSAQAHVDLGQALQQTGNSSQALNQFVEALSLDSNSVPALLGYGRNCNEDWQGYARAAFLKASKISPSSVDAWIGLGRADVGLLSHWVEAVSAFQTAKRLDPSRFDYDDLYAVALRHTDRPDDAEAMLRRLVTKDSSSPSAHFQLGSLLMQHNTSPARLLDAQNETSIALKLQPGVPEAETQLGEIYLRRGNTSLAIALLSKAQADDPYSAAAPRLLAQAFAKSNRASLCPPLVVRAEELSGALDKLDSLSLQRNTRFLQPAYHLELAQLYSQTGQPNKRLAEERILGSLRRDPVGTARNYRQFQSWLQAVLGPAATA